MSNYELPPEQRAHPKNNEELLASYTANAEEGSKSVSLKVAKAASVIAAGGVVIAKGAQIMISESTSLGLGQEVAWENVGVAGLLGIVGYKIIEKGMHALSEASRQEEINNAQENIT